MLNKVACVAVFIIGASLVVGAVTAEEGSVKVDAHTLLVELGAMVKEIPDTKEECQALLKNIRAWQEKKRRELQAQAVSPKYGFEYEWIAQDYKDSRACTQVLYSNERAAEGDCSLKMIIDLIGDHEEKSKGEAWVDMRQTPPRGEHIPADLMGRTVTAWVYAPAGARGERSRPNGFQVFVKDKGWKSQYGSWRNVTEGKWVKISLRVSSFKPRDGWMDKGFDPHQIIAVGVKMGAGGGSQTKYKGPIFVDAVDW